MKRRSVASTSGASVGRRGRPAKASTSDTAVGRRGKASTAATSDGSASLNEQSSTVSSTDGPVGRRRKSAKTATSEGTISRRAKSAKASTSDGSVGCRGKSAKTSTSDGSVGRRGKLSKASTSSGSVSRRAKSSKASTSDVSVVRRGRRPNNKMSTVITKKEKKAFYDLLCEKGFSCLKNEELLTQTLPNRTISEINAMIDNYSRKGQDSDTSDGKQPIETWFELIHQTIPNATKKDDLSAVLVDILSEMSAKGLATNGSDGDEEATDSDLKPDFKQIYACIGDALSGRYVPQLRPIDAFVFVKLIEELKELLRDVDHNKELDYLTSGQWMCGKKSGEEVFADVYKRRQRQNAAENGETGAGDTSAQSVRQTRSSDHSFGAGDGEETRDEEADGVAMDFVEFTTGLSATTDKKVEILQNYPKLRKISECLNPIKIPIELMAEQTLRW